MDDNSHSLVLHDAFPFPDGGGKVAMVLAKTFHAKLWTGHLNSSCFPDTYFKDIIPLSLQAYDTSPFWLRFSKTCQMMHSFSHFPLQNPCSTIFSGSLSLLAYKRITGPKILYCHTPPRLLYDQRNFYIRQTAFIRCSEY